MSYPLLQAESSAFIHPYSAFKYDLDGIASDHPQNEEDDDELLSVSNTVVLQPVGSDVRRIIQLYSV